MVFNMRLTFVKENNHCDCLYKDPMGQWAVKVEETPSVLEAAPWKNYQGDIYMGENGERYVVTQKLEKMTNWGVEVQEELDEGPPQVDSKDCKLLNTILTRRV